MKKLFAFGILLFGSICYAQDSRYDFVYDTAGNQITANRFIYISAYLEPAEGKTSSEKEDYVKFYEEDTFSYYPNPVSEELNLKWENRADEIISTFRVFSPSGALLKEYTVLENERQYIIPFKDYPQGFYIVQVGYTNGSVKSITIVKK